MNGWLVFAIILMLLLSGSYFGWYFYARWNASRNGLPPPSMNPLVAFSKSSGSASASNYPGPAPVGIKGWFDAQVYKFKNRNNRYTTGGGYEEPAYGAGATRGRGAGSRLDPDEAWSSRVGDEAYYEEQELGLHEPAPTHSQSANPYQSTTAYGGPSATLSQEPSRGRSRQRDSYDEHGDAQSGRNPFGDDNAASLRGVSPRPLGGEDTSYHGGATATMPSVSKHKKTGSRDSADNSPTESRRSIFREGL
ncbi:hypothetical protein J1614_005819 [Plenodomus biglobosus]|nr:hypothetical protein J1614_005819 [Plenodomus biglobosus]